MIEEYDPNSRWGKHTWEFTFQVWGYTVTMTQDVGGNCRGYRTISAAIHAIANKLYMEQGDYPEIHMTMLNQETGEEETLLNTLGEDDVEIEDELFNMLVKAELIDFTEEKKK